MDTEFQMLRQLNTGPALIDRVHDQLVEAIASGDLEPGRRLTQENVASMLGVSRQPVSHALQVLKRRGLLVEHGKRGLAVAPIDRQRLIDLYEIREMLDGLAARRAAQCCRDGNAPDAARLAFSDALHAGLNLSKDTGVRERVLADVTFHTALHHLSGNPEIVHTMAEQWPQFMRAMGVILNAKGRRDDIWQEHEKIAEAVLTGCPGEAEEAARTHARNAAQGAATLLPDAEVAA